MSELVVFKYGYSKKCPKCGHEDVGTKYLKNPNAVWFDFGRLLGLSPEQSESNLPEEAQKRTCKRCAHLWIEIPADHPKSFVRVTIPEKKG